MNWRSRANFAYNANGVPHRIVGIGDSVTEGLNEWDEQLNGMCRGRVYDKGVAGDRLSTANNVASIEARFQADVIDFGASWVIVAAGINDIKLDVTPVPNMQATVPAIHTLAVAAGIRFEICNVSPFGGNGAWTAGKEVDRLAYNAWLSAWCITNSVKMYDINSVLVDPVDSTLLFAAYHDGDELHPNALGASKVAEYIYQENKADFNGNRL